MKYELNNEEVQIIMESLQSERETCSEHFNGPNGPIMKERHAKIIALENKLEADS